jgi:hypothetical protein
MDTFLTMPVNELKHLHMDPEHPVPGAGDGLMLSDFNDTAIDALVGIAGAGSGSPLLSVEVRHAGRRARPQGRPVPVRWRRSTGGSSCSRSHGADPGAGCGRRAHVELVQNALAQWDSGRTYLNFARSASAGAALRRPHLPRLQTVKAAVDPDDVFRSNHPGACPRRRYARPPSPRRLPWSLVSAPVTRDQELELTIDSLAYGGNGVARLDGFVVFVRAGCPATRCGRA